MKTTGSTAAALTNVFGGSINNEGMGLFSLSFDWQYVRKDSSQTRNKELTHDGPLQITSFNTSLPLNLQVHAAVGYLVCFCAMAGIYYTNAWESRSLPFMSTTLKLANGTSVSSFHNSCALQRLLSPSCLRYQRCILASQELIYISSSI